MKRYISLLLACSLSLYLVGCDDEETSCLSGCDYDYTTPNSERVVDETTGEEAERYNYDQYGNPIPIDTPEVDVDPNTYGKGPSASDNENTDTAPTCETPCKEDETCHEGVCVPICPDTTYCDGKCVDTVSLHLDDCTTCAVNYCDADNDLTNGCETYTQGSDVNNCGGCGIKCDTASGEVCADGQCKSQCSDGETYCNGTCLNLGALHLSACNACAADYCDADGNISNGCELYVKASDNNNCGACGNVCPNGTACSEGACKSTYNAHRMLVVNASSLNVRTGNSTSYSKIGALNEYTYVTVLEESGGWYRIDYNGQAGWISGSYLLDAGDQYPGRKAIDYAEQFLYTKTGYCTYDHLTHAPIITNFVDLWASYGTYNHGYNNNCANFVTASLVNAGMIAKNMIAVSTIYNYCKAGTEGYRLISISDAKPGDIWMNTSLGHTELVVGNYNGTLILIGSNNFSSSNYNGCAIDTGAEASKYQRVSYGSSTSGYVCSKQ